MSIHDTPTPLPVTPTAPSTYRPAHIDARAVSVADLHAKVDTVDGEVRKLKGEVQGLKTQFDTFAPKVDAIHGAVVGITKNPKVRTAAWIVGQLIIMYAASKGLKVLP